MIYWSLNLIGYGCDIHGNVYCNIVPDRSMWKSIKNYYNEHGFYIVKLYTRQVYLRFPVRGINKHVTSHRFIYETINRCSILKGFQINHINEIKDDNRISNLEVVTALENNNHGTRIDRFIKSITGTHSGVNSKLSKDLKYYEETFVFKSRFKRTCSRMGWSFEDFIVIDYYRYRDSKDNAKVKYKYRKIELREAK